MNHIYIIILSLLLVLSCKPQREHKHGSHEEHNTSEYTHNYEAHDHQYASVECDDHQHSSAKSHNHHGGTHEHQEHHSAESHKHTSHKVESHHHESHSNAEGHSGEIVLAPEVAKRVGIETSVVEYQPFTAAIRCSGQVLASPDCEKIILASSSGIVHWQGGTPSIGTMVSKGQELAKISTSSDSQAHTSTAATTDRHPQSTSSQSATSNTNAAASNASPSIHPQSTTPESTSAKHSAAATPITAQSTSAKHSAAQINYEAAKRNFERAQRLRSENIISDKDYLAAKTEFELARSAYEGLSVYASDSGYYSAILAPEGSFVEQYSPIATISSNSTLRLQALLPARYAAYSRSINSARFRPDHSEQIYSTSKLISIAQSLSGAYIPITFEIQSPTTPILPGSYAEIWLLGQSSEQAIVLPEDALIEEQSQFFVYIQADEDCYYKQAVLLGARNADQVQILQGLEPGQIVVSKAAYQVKLASASVIPGHTHNH